MTAKLASHNDQRDTGCDAGHPGLHHGVEQHQLLADHEFLAAADLARLSLAKQKGLKHPVVFVGQVLHLWGALQGFGASKSCAGEQA